MSGEQKSNLKLTLNPRVLLLNLPALGQVHRDVGCAYTSKSDYYYPQADLLMLGAIAKKNNHDLKLIDYIFNPHLYSPEKLKQLISDFEPQHIFTLISSITLKSDLDILKNVKQYFKGKIWVCGDVVMYNTKEVIRDADVLVRDFTNALDIEKLLDKDFDGQQVVEVSNSKEFSIGISPHELFNVKGYHNPYSLNSPTAMLLTNWGCPFGCTFCAARNVLDSGGLDFRYKVRDTKEVIAELKYIEQLGFKEVYFRDFTFGIPRTEDLLDQMIQHRIKLKWSCATRIDVVNEKILKKMKDAGCYLIFYGADGSDDDTLKQIGKKVKIDKLFDTVRRTKSMGIEVLTSFILGFENQKPSELQSFIMRLKPDYLSLSILQPTIGSDMRREKNWESNIYDNYLNDSTYSNDPYLVKWRNKIEREFYLNPLNALKMIKRLSKSRFRFKVFTRSGLGLVKKWIRKSNTDQNVIGR